MKMVLLAQWHRGHGMSKNIVVSVLPLGRFLASIFSTLSCFPPFSSVPHMTTLRNSFSIPNRFLPLGLLPIIRPHHLPQKAFASDYMTNPIFLPSQDHLHKTSFFLYHL